MKILYIIDSFTTGGTEKSLLDILRVTSNIDPVVCGIYKDDTLLETFIQSGIKTYHLKINAKYAWMKAFRMLSRVIEIEKPDLVHSSLYRSNILARVLCTKYKITLVNSLVNDSYGQARRTQMSFARKLKLYLTFLIDRYTVTNVTAFISNSEAIKISNSRVLRIAPSKITVIHRGRDSRIFLRKFSDEEVERVRAELNLTKDDFVFVNIGRLISQKGQLDVLKALPEVIKNYENAKLIIAGEGPERQKLQNWIDNNYLGPFVKLLGTRADVPILLKMSNVFVFPSYSEGHSGALIEAMFAGIPIIASDIGPNLETLDESMGVIVRAGDIPALQGAMVNAIRNRDKMTEMAFNAQMHARNKFEIKEVTKAHEKFYFDLKNL